MSSLLNDEGVTRDDVKWWKESARFADIPSYAKLPAVARGVFHSLRYLAHAQGALPHDPALLACLTRLSEADIHAGLPMVIESGLFVRSDKGDTIFCPIAEAYAEQMVGKIVQRKIVRRHHKLTP